MKKHCLVCALRRPKKLESRYAHATIEAVFCAQKCASEYALLAINSDLSMNRTWCKKHGWEVAY